MRMKRCPCSRWRPRCRPGGRCAATLWIRRQRGLRKLFDVRPIWSRNAVKANISIHPDKLKILLPLIAYYMITGPWRSLWIRFGYDPASTRMPKFIKCLISESAVE